MTQTFSRYEILEKLGQGGMATVYKAHDSRLGRNVAIKVIASDTQGSQRFLKRFQQEARALANLNHPNIVQVLDFGEEEGVPFLVMDYLPGGTLKDRLGKPLGWQEAAGFLAPVARALAYAHERKIIHRDVKPSNILFDTKGQPVLTDFGIAKVLEQELTMDLTGTGVIGTPQYMSPEQGLGKSVDVRTDVYSLGVVLYELIAGKKPFGETTPIGILLQQTRQPLTPPRQHNKDIPVSVEQIVFAALSPKPEDRFPNMSAFADALEKMAQGEKVVLTKELIRRSRPRHSHRTWPWFVAGLVVAGALAAAGILWSVANQKPNPTPVSLAVLVDTVTAAAPLLTPTVLPPTQTETLQPPTATLPIPTETATALPTPGIQALLPENAVRWKIIAQNDRLLGDIQSCAFAPDGKLAVTAPKGKAGEVWDLTSKTMLRNLTLSNTPLTVQKAVFSPDGSQVAGLVDYGGVWVWNVKDGALLHSFYGKSRSMAYAPDSQRLAVGYYEDHKVKVWDVSNGQQIGDYLQRSTVEDVVFSPNGLNLWINTSLSLNIWRALDGTHIQTLDDPDVLNGSYTVLSERQDLFYTNGSLWKISDDTLAFTLSTAQDPFPCAVFSPDGGLFTACVGGQVLVWETAGGTLVRTLETGFQANTIALAFTTDGSRLLLAAEDGTVEEWAAE